MIGEPGIICTLWTVNEKEVTEKVKEGIDEQIKMNDGNMFMLGSISDNKVKHEDVDYMAKAAEKCHGEDGEKEIEAYDDVSGHALDPKGVQVARQKNRVF